jgi:hypothetical protein
MRVKVSAVQAKTVITVEISDCPVCIQSFVINKLLRHFSGATALHTFEPIVQLQPQLDQADCRTNNTLPGKQGIQQCLLVPKLSYNILPLLLHLSFSFLIYHSHSSQNISKSSVQHKSSKYFQQ